MAAEGKRPSRLDSPIPENDDPRDFESNQGLLAPGEGLDQPGRSARAGAQLWHLIVGRPLATSQAAGEQITSLQALPALSLDALSSVAYGPEAIVVVLAAAGLPALHLVMPITVAIVLLLALLVSSYRQVIEGYPAGGGAYSVARANLNRGASQLAAASLIVDYTLTVSVSIAAGVGALTSAFPSLASSTVPLCLAILGIITVLNLRGPAESARVFFLPAAVFILGIFAVIAIGLTHPLAPHLRLPGRALVASRALTRVGVLLVLKAFSSGCSALTGIEAIANSVTVFRQPQVRRAKRAELLLGAILGPMLLGLAALANKFKVGPRSSQTVLSQVTALALGRGVAFYVVSLSVTSVLGLAANTSFGSLPVLSSLLARDNYLPHAFALRGERLVYNWGVWTLALLAGALLVAVGGSTQDMIPLYAIGVFTGFTLAQAGMVIHWRRARPTGWRWRATLNGVGSVVTGVATVIFVLTKFLDGAWLVMLAVPSFVLLFNRVEQYYRDVGRQLGLGEKPPKPIERPVRVFVLVRSVSRLTAQALTDAMSISDDVVALSVCFADEDQLAESLATDWSRWDPGVSLVTLRSEYHSVVDPVLVFIRSARAATDRRIVVLIPVVLPRRWRYRILHNQLDLVLSKALRYEPGVVVARVPWRPGELDGTVARASP